MNKIKIFAISLIIIFSLISCSRFIRSYKLKLTEPAFFTKDMSKFLDYKFFKLNRPKSNDWFLLKSEQYIDHCVIHFISNSPTYTAFFEINKYDAVNNIDINTFKELINKNFFGIENKQRFVEKSNNLIFENVQNGYKCIFEQIVIDNDAANKDDNEQLIMRNSGYILYKNSDKSKLLHVLFSERGTENEIRQLLDEENYLINSVTLK